MRALLLVLLHTLLLAVFASPSVVYAQAPPADFKFTATTGGVAPWSEKATLTIDNNGLATYTRYTGPVNVLAESTFTISGSDLQTLWKAVQDSNFFSLNSAWSDSTVSDGTFARIMVTANGGTHDVNVKNIRQPAIQEILRTLNSAIPSNVQLPYVPPDTVDSTPRDPCSETFGAIRGQPQGLSKLSDSPDLKLRAFPGPYYARISSAPPAAPAHPGVVVACDVTLQDAVTNGWATLSSKGDFFGDDISITVNNKNRPPCPEVSITLYLEFYGPLATEANIDAVCADIAKKWVGAKTGDGRPIEIGFRTLSQPGATSRPNTPGYDQIQLVPNGSVRSYVQGSQSANSGTGLGVWEVPPAGPGMYAHEAGHLMGLPDRYTDYNKQADGSWKNAKTGQSYANDDAFANYLAAKTPGSDVNTIKNNIKNQPTVSVPLDGSENDLMAALDKPLTQADIDALTANPGLLVSVPNGLVFANRKGNDQNMIVVHKEDVYAGPGQSRTLNGIYAACIDHSKGIPSFEGVFDVAPPVSQWAGIEAAGYMARLLNYVDSAGLYCGSNFSTQEAIWRISDNTPTEFSVKADSLLQAAGINLGNRILDFPRIGGSGLKDSASHPIVPSQLYVADIRPGFAAGQVGVANNFTARVALPSGVPHPTGMSWSATGPDSAPAPIAGTDSTASLTPTRTGIYQVALRFSLDDSLHGQKSIVSDRKGYVIVPDEYTETFEHPGLTDKYPWKSYGDVPWVITTDNPETGTSAAQPGSTTQASTIGIEVNLPADSVIIFSVRAFTSGFFDGVSFSIDSVQQERFGGGLGWNLEKYRVPAGRHLLTWTFQTYSTNPATGAGLDNIFFPGNVVVTGVGDKTPDVPKVFALEQNYPNPFNPKTVVSSQLPVVSNVRIVIYDLLGREVKVLVNERRAAGKYEDVFDASNLASGVYIYRMTAGSFVQTRRMVLIK